MNSIRSIVEVTPSSFDSLVGQQVVPVLLAAYDGESSSGVAFLSLFSEVAATHQGGARWACIDLRKCPEFAQRIEVAATPALLLYWAGEARYHFIGQCSRRELEEVLARAQDIAFPAPTRSAKPLPEAFPRSEIGREKAMS